MFKLDFSFRDSMVVAVLATTTNIYFSFYSAAVMLPALVVR